jgi:hypothetical protein
MIAALGVAAEDQSGVRTVVDDVLDEGAGVVGASAAARKS